MLPSLCPIRTALWPNEALVDAEGHRTICRGSRWSGCWQRPGPACVLLLLLLLLLLCACVRVCVCVCARCALCVYVYVLCVLVGFSRRVFTYNRLL